MVADQLSLIDTDALSYILKRKEPAYQNSLHYLQKFGGLKISCLSYYECRRGYQAIGATKKVADFPRLTANYRGSLSEPTYFGESQRGL